MSYGGESFEVRSFFIVAPIVLGACLIMLFSVDERGHLGDKKSLQTTFICQGRRTVLCPWARHIYPCFSTGSNQEDPSRYIWKIVDWEVKNQIKQNQGRSQRMLSCWNYQKMKNWDSWPCYFTFQQWLRITKALIRLRERPVPLLFFEISRIEAHVMLKLRHSLLLPYCAPLS